MKTYNEVMHGPQFRGIGIEAMMFRIFGMKLGYFFERNLKKLFKRLNDK